MQDLRRSVAGTANTFLTGASSRIKGAANDVVQQAVSAAGELRNTAIGAVNTAMVTAEELLNPNRVLQLIASAPSRMFARQIFARAYAQNLLLSIAQHGSVPRMYHATEVMGPSGELDYNKLEQEARNFVENVGTFHPAFVEDFKKSIMIRINGIIRLAGGAAANLSDDFQAKHGDRWITKSDMIQIERLCTELLNTTRYWADVEDRWPSIEASVLIYQLLVILGDVNAIDIHKAYQASEDVGRLLEAIRASKKDLAPFIEKLQPGPGYRTSFDDILYDPEFDFGGSWNVSAGEGGSEPFSQRRAHPRPRAQPRKRKCKM